jgi:hypothetical protein
MKKNNKHWIKLCKEIYYSYGVCNVPLKGVKQPDRWQPLTGFRRPESWKDWITNSRMAHRLRNTPKRHSNVWEQLDQRKSIKKMRRESRDIILDGIQDWDDRYVEYDTDYELFPLV